MKRLYGLLLGATTAALTVLATAAQAQTRPASLGPRITLPTHSNHFSWERGHGFKRGFPGVWIVEREVPPLDYARDERKKKEAPPPPAAAANSGTPNRDVPGLPRKPYVVGATYASLPGGCMKMVELAASYYFCGGGEWYRQVGEGPSARYKAVARKL